MNDRGAGTLFVLDNNSLLSCASRARAGDAQSNKDANAHRRRGRRIATSSRAARARASEHHDHRNPQADPHRRPRQISTGERRYIPRLDDKTTVKTFAESVASMKIEGEAEKARAGDVRNRRRASAVVRSRFDVKSTGTKETINGWTAPGDRDVTLPRRGIDLKSGGWVRTSEMWMGRACRR